MRSWVGRDVFPPVVWVGLWPSTAVRVGDIRSFFSTNDGIMVTKRPLL